MMKYHDEVSNRNDIDSQHYKACWAMREQMAGQNSMLYQAIIDAGVYDINLMYLSWWKCGIIILLTGVSWYRLWAL